MLADAGPPRDGSVPLTWVEFSIAGCDTQTSAGRLGGDAGPDGDGGVPPTCRATAPVSLGFTAIAPGQVDTYLWSFGDGTEDVADVGPRHAFRLPGTYDVTLSVGGPGGTATVTRYGAVDVRPAPLGARCDLDGQCGGGTCVCDGEATCPAGLASGMCAAACDAATPCAVGVCADLAPTNPSPAEDWQRSACLRVCAQDSECPTGLRCRDLKPVAGSGWVRGCFPDSVLGAIGGSCVDASGTTDDAACASGMCIGEGARGLCSEACTAGTCPGGAACASFAGGLGSLCLARCTSASDCADDPWLSCEPAGGPGDKGFTVDETAAASGYCAPKACTGAPGDCGTDGACVAGFCAAT